MPNAVVTDARAIAEYYRERYDRAAYLRGAYPDLIHERVKTIRKRYGFDRREPEPEPELWPRDAQMDLFETAPITSAPIHEPDF